MTGNDIRNKYLKFMEEKGHRVVPSASIMPENDPTTLFTGSGMQPMVPYLLGESHPLGNRIVDSQKCFRAEDIEEVGDNRHTTIFEMLGNWSLGSYWKEDQLTWIFNFLTKTVGLNPEQLYVTVFAGDEQNNIQKDTEAVEIWKKLFKETGIEAKDVELITEKNGAEKGMQGGRIFYYEAKKNWWSRAGVPQNMPVGEPGGPDSEIFFEFTDVEHDPKFGDHCHPNCDCGRFMEIGNSVFMTYIKKDDGSFQELPQKNIDFGGGLERIAAAANNNPDVFEIDVFKPIITALENFTQKPYAEHKLKMRIIADHLKAAILMIAEGLEPGNKQQGYVLRRLIRRAVLKMHQLDIVETQEFGKQIVGIVSHIYSPLYLDPKTTDLPHITEIVVEEIKKFERTLKKGLKEFESRGEITGKIAFDLLQTYGFPWELTYELATEKGYQVDKKEFEAEFAAHKEKSRTASTGMFKGGLADHSEAVTKFHTATHLLHKALRDVLGDHVQQMGSNITAERLRFDFKHPEKLTPEELEKVEAVVNLKITEDLPVHKTIENKDEALQQGAMAFFREKYPDKVSVYTIGLDPKTNWFSKELCGGPHVSSTGQIGPVTIKKEESVGAGTRRIYMVFRQ